MKSRKINLSCRVDISWRGVALKLVKHIQK